MTSVCQLCPRMRVALQITADATLTTDAWSNLRVGEWAVAS